VGDNFPLCCSVCNKICTNYAKHRAQISTVLDAIREPIEYKSTENSAPSRSLILRQTLYFVNGTITL